MSSEDVRRTRGCRARRLRSAVAHGTLAGREEKESEISEAKNPGSSPTAAGTRVPQFPQGSVSRQNRGGRARGRAAGPQEQRVGSAGARTERRHPGTVTTRTRRSPQGSLCFLVIRQTSHRTRTGRLSSSSASGTTFPPPSPKRAPQAAH